MVWCHEDSAKKWCQCRYLRVHIGQGISTSGVRMQGVGADSGERRMFRTKMGWVRAVRPNGSSQRVGIERSAGCGIASVEWTVFSC